MKTLKKVSCLLLALVALGASACSPTKAYSGPSRSSDETAVVRAYGVTLHQVNGTQIGSTSTGAKVLAGQSEIKLTINASNFNSPGIDEQLYTLMLNAEGGREYAITGKRGYGRVCAWPIDPDSGSPDFRQSAGCISR